MILNNLFPDGLIFNIFIWVDIGNNQQSDNSFKMT